MAVTNLWTSGEAAKAMKAEFAGPTDQPIGSVSIDSRTVDNDAIFFAIKGDRFDGHAFVEKALGDGAAFAVVAKDKLSELSVDPARIMVVDDVLVGMEELGRAARARHAGKVIAITGSVGKTGTKEMLRHVFSANGKTHASVASFNNHWGVPLTLSRTPSDIDFGIYEIGMNHPGEIIPLVDMVRPDVAIITTVEPVHLEFFDNEQEIARAKAEIFTGIASGGTAVLNLDNRHFDFLKKLADEQAINIATFGEGEGADVRLISADLGEEGTTVRASVFGREVTYRLSQPGRHIVQNSLAVCAALHLTDADLDVGLATLAAIEAGRGRGARLELDVDGGTITILDESYNANPASMRAAIGLLGAAQCGENGRRIAVLGDMLELGEDSDALHAGLHDALDAANIDLAFLSGPHMKALFETIPAKMRGKYAATSDGLEESLLDTVAKGDVLMVKGSLGSRMGPIVDKLTAHFPTSSRV